MLMSSLGSLKAKVRRRRNGYRTTFVSECGETLRKFYGGCLLYNFVLADFISSDAK